jgi:hypothetical protein
MLTGLSGSLLSHHFAERILQEEFSGRIGERTREATHKQLTRWWHRQSLQLGPASSVRAIWAVAVELAEHLGFVVEGGAEANETRYSIVTLGNARLVLFTTSWNGSLDSLWRAAVRGGIGADAPWVLCTNGHEWRLVDAQRTYSRAYLAFDLQQTFDDPRAFGVFWAVMRAEAFRSSTGKPPLITELVQSSARHGQAVSRSLRFGVIDALRHLLGALNGCGRHGLPQLMDESLTIVYRLLFLMFAESRRLVPNWHPIYRDSYTVQSLRDRAEGRGPSGGLWETMQAIARLAHTGCRAGTLVVPPFNGRLFSPAQSPIAESCAVDDEAAREALLALSTTTPGRWIGDEPKPARQTTCRTRIDYRDLGVEQLGAVYESVLDYQPAFADSGRRHVVLQRGGIQRKSTGSFYTPQTITDFVVRRTLHPLVDGATSGRILALRVLDPAMGTAAFLVSACRYLARAYERALIAEGALHDGDAGESDRAAFRRLIAQRCLFGVDLNPTAVQLARLSLWLATLAASKPLTFLDHHLVCGNSLLGASPVDLARQPPSAGSRPYRRSEFPLFLDSDLEPSLARAVAERTWLAETRDDTADVVREKERRLERLRAQAGGRSVADLWCACWMWPDPARAPDPPVFASLVEKLTTGHCGLPERISAALLDEMCRVVQAYRFFHWTFEFPEAYFDEAGRPLPNGGFDAVVGNPPWDMLRTGGAERTFVRCSGVYRHQTSGHINRYQTFVERALRLTRRGGRIGLVLPSGFATDHSSAALRRELLASASVDTISGFDNRKAIFPIHRSVRFLVCTATVGAPTNRIACRFGIDDAAELETIPDAGDRPAAASHPVSITPAFLATLDAEKLAIPELRTATDLRILERIVHAVPRLDAPAGWNVRFGRELNATDDRVHFHAGRAGLPVLEGKHIEPFCVHVQKAALRISERSAARLLDAAATFVRPRLAYRDVASSTNRLSLIAAILPAGVVTTHSLFCLKTRLSGDNQAFLCAMLNSYVANYLVRQMMTTHLGSATVEGLRVPRPPYSSPAFEKMVELSHSLRNNFSSSAYARLQALAASCYGLDIVEFAHVLSTFPLVEPAERDRALEEFRHPSIFE